MFDRLKRGWAGLTGEAAAAFSPDDHRVALAALLLHTAAIDGRMTEVESRRIGEIVGGAFALDEATTESVLIEAARRERETRDVSAFTRILERSLAPEGRQRAVELLWDVARVDGRMHEFEETMLRRVADLLHVPGRDER